MPFEQALQIMVNGTHYTDERHEAIKAIELAVLAVSQHGDPNHSLQDWVDACQYWNDDTPEIIAEEWDFSQG